MIHGLAALGKLDDFVWTPKVLIRDQVIRSCIMNNDDSQTFKNTIGIKVQNMKMDFVKWGQSQTMNTNYENLLSV